jgi:uncharacterized membrane protein
MPGYPAGGASVGNAFNWGWKKFTENIGTILVAAILYFVVLAVVQGIGFIFIGNQFDDSGDGGFWGDLFAQLVLLVVAFVVQAFLQAGIIRGATQITHGRKPTLATMFTSEQLGQVLLAGLLVGIAVAIGFLLLIIPGLIVLFYTQFTYFFVVERRLPAVDAIKASAGLINQHVGTMVGFFFASLLAYIVGAILCGVGLIVAVPVVILAQAFMYRTLQGEAVAP